MSNPPTPFSWPNRANAKRKPQSPSPFRKTPKTDTPGLTAKKPRTQDRVHEESKKVVKKEAVNLKEKIALLKNKGSSFNPRSAAFWKDGESIPFVLIARTFDLISNESGSIIKTNILCNVFRTVMATTPVDLVCFVYLCACKIYPAHHGIELGIGNAAIMKSLSEVYGKSEEDLKNCGDLGSEAQKCRSSQSKLVKFAPLTVAKVLETFRVLAKVSGKNSEKRKRDCITKLLFAACDCEPMYIIRLLQSKLTIGLAEQTVLAALAQAAAYSEQLPGTASESDINEAVKVIHQVYSVHRNYDTIVSAILSDGVSKLSDICAFVPGVPIKPMLAKATKEVSEILNKFQNKEFTCEYKYDGERAQIHYLEDGSVHIYSRNGKTYTGKYPDVIQSVQRFKKPSVTSFILDCEVVAFDRTHGQILPFQILGTRDRKDVSINEITVQVCIFAFDILYLNGELLLQRQLNSRRKHLYNSFVEVPGEFKFATQVTSNDLDVIQSFLDDSIADSCEGLIVKTLSTEATYEPAKKTNNWLKLKKDYMVSDGPADSLDLVPIGAYRGNGKLSHVYGSFLCACYDDKKREFQCISKMGIGFSEKFLEECYSSFQSRVIPKPKSCYRFAEATKPDVWFEPTEVWEVKAAKLTISPDYCAAAGAVDKIKGISLRFPRLIRVRKDKEPEEATTSDQVAEMYRAQP